MPFCLTAHDIRYIFTNSEIIHALKAIYKPLGCSDQF